MENTASNCPDSNGVNIHDTIHRSKSELLMVCLDKRFFRVTLGSSHGIMIEVSLPSYPMLKKRQAWILFNGSMVSLLRAQSTRLSRE